MRIKRYFPPLKTSWHHWFAWYPVKAMTHWVWLEPVLRKEVYGDTIYTAKYWYRTCNE